MTRLLRFALPALLLASLGTLAAQAQTQGFNRVDATRSNINAYYYYVQPGMATVQVHVLGTVRAPGLYVLNQGTHLGDLLALSGGPVVDVRQADARRKITIRLFRAAAYGDEPIYESTLDDAVSRRETYPVLQEGDVLTVEVVEKRRFGWRDALSIVGGVSALAVALDRFLSLSSN